jgi:hypothetical protein
VCATSSHPRLTPHSQKELALLAGRAAYLVHEARNTLESRSDFITCAHIHELERVNRCLSRIAIFWPFKAHARDTATTTVPLLWNVQT